MRKFFVFAAVVVFFIGTQSSLVSCTKTNTVVDTVTVIKKDTVIINNDTAVSEAILTANSWKVQEVRALLSNTTVFYLRGGSSNTLSFDNEYVTFNADHTGLYVDNNGGTSTLTWNFTNAANTTLVWTWNLPTPVVVTWEHVYYKKGALHYDEYYAQSGVNVLTAEIRIPSIVVGYASCGSNAPCLLTMDMFSIQLLMSHSFSNPSIMIPHDTGNSLPIFHFLFHGIMIDNLLGNSKIILT